VNKIEVVGIVADFIHLQLFQEWKNVGVSVRVHQCKLLCHRLIKFLRDGHYKFQQIPILKSPNIFLTVLIDFVVDFQHLVDASLLQSLKFS
jgi:hypothetical protein